MIARAVAICAALVAAGIGFLSIAAFRFFPRHRWLRHLSVLLGSWALGLGVEASANLYWVCVDFDRTIIGSLAHLVNEIVGYYP